MRVVRCWAIAALVCLIAPSVGSAYVRSKTPAGEPLIWARRCIPWHLYEAGSQDLAFEVVYSEVAKSFDAWAAEPCTGIEFVNDGWVTNDPRVGRPEGADVNTVVFIERGWGHDPHAVALTTVTFCVDERGDCDFAGQILDADIELNGEVFRFTTGAGGRDLRNTVTHEAGHVIGLDHSQNTYATMYDASQEGERSKATLHEDDVSALCTIYPRPEPLPACEDFPVEGDYVVDPASSSDTKKDRGTSACNVNGGPPSWEALALVLHFLARRRRTRCAQDS